MSDEKPDSLEDRVRSRLAGEWEVTASDSPAGELLPGDVWDAIRQSINSTTKTYRYVLPAQLLPKLVEPTLDCRSVQAGAGLPGSFDARSICQHVIVPFDRENNNVLGGAPEPYANNPLRIPALIPAHRSAQKNKRGFDYLMAVLDYAQRNPEKVELIVRTMLAAIRERLAVASVVYPVPNRVSLKQTVGALQEYLRIRSGGIRMQAVAVALFRTIGERFTLFNDIRSNNINAADASTGNTADLECVDDEGHIVLAVEVKDRQLELRHVEDKLPGVRERGVRELLFLIQGGVAVGDGATLTETVSRQFVTGQNVYIVEWSEFLSSCLILFGEEGRRDFLRHIGPELDERRIDITHRRAWAQLLSTL